MKIYQVYSGDTDKYDNQYYELKGSYLDKDKALEQCQHFVDQYTKVFGAVEKTTYNFGNSICWDDHGYDIVTICKLETVDLIE
jgi:hypothetical protein